jgi:ERCC4-related helicase
VPLKSSLETYSKKLDLFEKGIEEGKIVSLKDIEALELSFGDEDLDIDAESLEENTLDTIDEKNYELDMMKQDLIKEKELVLVIREQLEYSHKDDSKIKCFGTLLDKLEKKILNKKVLVFSYYADTINYIQDSISRIRFECK